MPATGSTPQAAPGELELVREFVNTNDVEDGIEELATPKLLAEWMRDHGLDVGDRSLTKRDVSRAITLREALRALLLANGGEPLDAGAVETLNAAAARADLQVSFGGDGKPSLQPAREGIDGALAALLAIVFRSMVEGTWPRLKACRADTCQWAFYDKSKNRSAHWCSMAVCGNRAKARSYRHRHSSERGTTVSERDGPAAALHRRGPSARPGRDTAR
jgi:predicted RNA-binding Zn ribbon-like protein